MKFPPLLLSLLILLVVAISSTTTSASAEDNSKAHITTKNDHSNTLVVVSTSLSDLPPLGRRVLKWSPFEVELWMNITVGYPELSSTIRTYLIDGPTLVNMNNFDKVFPNLHPAQEAKLKAHQKMLRGECACGGGGGSDNGDSSSSSAIDANRNFWTYLDYSSVSVTFHLTGTALAPRFTFFSAWFFDKPLLCCALAVPTTSELEKNAAAEELQMLTSSSSSSSDDTNSVAPSPYISPCGNSEELCQETPSVLTTILVIFCPWVLMFWHGLLRSFWPHPFITIVWILACLVLQVSEVITVYNIYGMIKKGQASLGEVLQEELIFGYLHWIFWGPMSAALVIGYFLPHWVSYLVLLALTILAGSNILTFVLNVMGSLGFLKSPGGAEGQQQEPGQHQQQQASSPQEGSAAAGMD